MSVGVGDKAPAFTLPGHRRRNGLAGRLRGKPVVLVFYPGDDTPVCTKQLNSYNHDLAEFEALDAQVLGISAQGVESHDGSPASTGFKFPLLADTDKAVAGAVRHARPARLPPPQRVHRRRRRRRSATPTGRSPA